jgi:GNAT superfamily N-acetyltransferase
VGVKPQSTIWRAGPADAGAASAIVAEAFLDEPVARWLFPDEDGRRRVGAPIFRSMVDQALAQGEVLLAENPRRSGGIAAVLLSLPMDADHSMTEHDFGEYAERLAIFAELTEECHTHFSTLAEQHYPGRGSHLYLPCLAVLAPFRGTGVGSALMHDRLARADAEGLAAYGDATSEGWATIMIERHGFEPMLERITLPGEPATEIWPVWRRPRGTK